MFPTVFKPGEIQNFSQGAFHSADFRERVRSRFYPGQQAANVSVLFAVRSADLDRRRYIGGLFWFTNMSPNMLIFTSIVDVNLSRRCAGNCVRWAAVSMTCTVVRPTAEEF